jgi:phospholipid-binding lipoprotein MlaA
VGRIADIGLDPSRRIADNQEFAIFTAARLVEQRATLLPMERVVEGAALDRYSFIRNAYLQRRQNLVYDGNPPEPKE